MKKHPEIQLNFDLAPQTDAAVFLNEAVHPLQIEHNGPFVRNRQGELICVKDKTAYLSGDNGQSWQAFKLFSTDLNLSAANSCSLLCTSQGTIILSFIDSGNLHFKWRKQSNAPTRNSVLFHYIVRSEDGGRSWQKPILLQKGYAAAATTLIQLKSGALIASAQNLDYQEARHYSLTFRSEDDGKIWQASNKLDIGGRGHHAGCYEGTLAELEDRVWFCLRTNLDYFWHAYSYDDGKTWTHIQPGIEASSSPAMLKRLASGKLIMLYNTLYPKGTDHFKRISGQFSEVAASWHREELSLIYSDDDGRSWSAPLLLARCRNAWLSYPYVFETSPGIIWITTMQSELRIQLREQSLAKLPR
ncbi:sialidase family protein [Thiomicrorhabdus sp.]|uniref:sialidase family protein n=1 Tax=Thiomicrorhabdus sp. TaxID=2039724 RepID=UPI0029C832E1|nr:sialidase family protein [Thiomicrorhabdus sp.]